MLQATGFLSDSEKETSCSWDNTAYDTVQGVSVLFYMSGIIRCTKIGYQIR